MKTVNTPISGFELECTHQHQMSDPVDDLRIKVLIAHLVDWVTVPGSNLPKWPATVPGAVNLLAILQGQHIVAGNLE